MNSKIFFVLILCIFQSTFVFIDDGSGKGRVVQAICCLIANIILIAKIKYVLRRKYVVLDILTALYIGVVLASTFNRGSVLFLSSNDRASNLLGILQAANALNFVLLIEYVTETNKGVRFLKDFYYIISVYTILIIIEVTLKPPAEHYDPHTLVHMMGDKFVVSYKVLLWTILYFILYTKMKHYNKGGLIVHILLTIYVCLRTGCMTALLGTLVISVLLLKNKEIKILYSPVSIIATILICFSFYFIYDYILNDPTVSDFIVNTLHKDPTLTGRTSIYERLPELIAITPTFGFFDTYDITMLLIGAPNAQNGIIQLYIQYGIYYVFIFMLIVLVNFRMRSKKGDNYGIILYLYFLALISCVEISLDFQYIAYSAMLIPSLKYNKCSSHTR